MKGSLHWPRLTATGASVLIPVLALLTLPACQDITQPFEPTFDALSATASSGDQHVYVTNIAAGGVQVISTASNTVVETVPVNHPLQVAITPDGASAYVTNFNPPSVKVIATATNTVDATIPLLAAPWGVAITPDGAFAYVAIPTAGEVHVIETATNTVAATVTVGSSPLSLAVTPDGLFAYVTNSTSSSVSVVETATNTVAATIGVQAKPWGVAITPNGAFAYVTHNTNQVSVIETATNTVVQTLGGFANPSNQPAITPDGAFAYIANFVNPGTVSVIETATNTVVAAIPVGNGPRGVGITPDGALAYVAVTFSGTVSVIETATNTVSEAVPVGGTCCTGPIGVAITPLLVVQVAIDIKPGSDPNSVNCMDNGGLIPMVILTTSDFDALTVDHGTVTFEGATETHVNQKTGGHRRHEEDVDGDGDIDLMFHFRLGDTGLDCASTEGTLSGETFDGQAIEGTDAIRMVDVP